MRFRIDAMGCGGCAGSVTKVIHSIDPQAKVDVELSMKRVTAVSGADEHMIAAGLEHAGYPARCSAFTRTGDDLTQPHATNRSVASFQTGRLRDA